MAKKAMFKWFCGCITLAGEYVYLVVSAATAKEASEVVHQEYAIDYIEDIYTPSDMATRKQHLAPALICGQELVPWWSVSPKKKPASPKAPKRQADSAACSRPHTLQHADSRVKRTRPPVGPKPGHTPSKARVKPQGGRARLTDTTEGGTP